MPSNLPGQRPPSPSERARVVVAAGPLVVGLLVVGLLAAGCSGPDTAPSPADARTDDVEVSGGPTPSPSATAAPTPTPTPTVEPTPTEAGPLPVSAPFSLLVDDIQIVSSSNAGVFGAAEAPVDDAVALAAVNAARDRLGAFLNAMIVQPETRLADAGIATLLDPALLAPEQRLGLGALGRDDVLGTVADGAHATAQVHITGTTVGAVTLFYSASFELVLVDADGQAQQAGTAAFVDRGAGMQLVGIDSTTTYSGDLVTVLS